jgi:mRNA interferase HigB
MVHIIKTQPIYEFARNNPKYKAALEAWVTIVESCSWEKPEDIIAFFGAKATDLLGKKDNKSSTLPCKRVVIDIKGNHLRIIAKYQFHPELKASRLYLKWIGTHTQYTELCKKKFTVRDRNV